MRAADEVPPHQDFLVQRQPAQQDQPHGRGAARQRERSGARWQVGHRVPRHRSPADGDVAGVDQHAVLVRALQRQVHRSPRLQLHFRPEQRRVGGGLRLHAEPGADEHPAAQSGVDGLLRQHVLELGRHLAGVIRERHPQLNPVQHSGFGGRDLGVRDAPAGRHQVEFTRPDHRVRADAVPVLDLPLEQPAHGLQTGVRVRRDRHAAGIGDPLRPVMIGEAPGADQRPGLLRQRPPDRHRPEPAERNVAGFEDLEIWSRRASRWHADLVVQTTSAGSSSTFVTPSRVVLGPCSMAPRAEGHRHRGRRPRRADRCQRPTRQ